MAPAQGLAVTLLSPSSPLCYLGRVRPAERPGLCRRCCRLAPPALTADRREGSSSGDPGRRTPRGLTGAGPAPQGGGWGRARARRGGGSGAGRYRAGGAGPGGLERAAAAGERQGTAAAWLRRKARTSCGSPTGWQRCPAASTAPRSPTWPSQVGAPSPLPAGRDAPAGRRAEQLAPFTSCRAGRQRARGCAAVAPFLRYPVVLPSAASHPSERGRCTEGCLQDTVLRPRTETNLEAMAVRVHRRDLLFVWKSSLFLYCFIGVTSRLLDLIYEQNAVYCLFPR